MKSQSKIIQVTVNGPDGKPLPDKINVQAESPRRSRAAERQDSNAASSISIGSLDTSKQTTQK
jgi:hypothetical protein